MIITKEKNENASAKQIEFPKKLIEEEKLVKKDVE